MLIDWFTVGAQALNFVILVWLLKRLLYKPVLDAIDAREQRIAAQISDAEARENKAQVEAEVLKQKNKTFDQQRAGMLEQATQQASAERERLIAAARAAADELAATRQQALHNEAQQLRETLADRTQQEVFAIARRTLADLASGTLEHNIAEMFVRRLRSLDEAAIAELAGGLGPQGVVVVRSVFELGPEQRNAIETALVEAFDGTPAPAPRFEYLTAPELICGIELVAGGNKIAWSIDQYLDSLDRMVDELLTSDAQPRPAVQQSQLDAQAQP